MRSLRFFVMVLAAGAAFAFVSFSTRVSNSNAAGAPAHAGSEMTGITNRKLKDNSNDMESTRNPWVLVNTNAVDYPCFDPVPSTKATIKSGPIEHEAPLMPYVPRLTPPDHPKHGSP
ncbi:hypothetical protein Cni_G01033 [Canna indica]|uniref:Uncharacterized protein n=1 Tax=Canna indica TaxID=4628 RepID=A0AAQ3JNN8_9LILI|nr:hypothetical protein Cni_G01033 [Canna indica]